MSSSILFWTGDKRRGKREPALTLVYWRCGSALVLCFQDFVGMTGFYLSFWIRSVGGAAHLLWLLCPEYSCCTVNGLCITLVIGCHKREGNRSMWEDPVASQPRTGQMNEWGDILLILNPLPSSFFRGAFFFPLKVIAQTPPFPSLGHSGSIALSEEEGGSATGSSSHYLRLCCFLHCQVKFIIWTPAFLLLPPHIPVLSGDLFHLQAGEWGRGNGRESSLCILFIIEEWAGILCTEQWGRNLNYSDIWW